MKYIVLRFWSIMTQSPCTGQLLIHVYIYSCYHTHTYVLSLSLSLIFPPISQIAPSVVSSHTPVSFTSEDPALLCRYPMPFGLNSGALRTG